MGTGANAGRISNGMAVSGSPSIPSNTFVNTVVGTVVSLRDANGADAKLLGNIPYGTNITFSVATDTAFKAHGIYNTAVIDIKSQKGSELFVLGGVKVGNPTGGLMGAGTLNAEGLSVQGAPIFPAPAALSAYVPAVTLANPGGPTDLTVAYTQNDRVGLYYQIGKLVFVQIHLTFNDV